MVAKPYHILIIEDDPADHEMVQRMLSQGRTGEYLFWVAETGTQGLALCQAEKFDCVILDYRLPDQDGLEVLRQLRSNPDLPDVAVVMLTGHGNETVAVQAMKYGAQDYLVKWRITEEGLYRAIHNAIDKVAFLQQIDDQRRELERLATIDSLTGLYNRRYFMERIDEEVGRAKRYEVPLSLLMLDLDHFKVVNDQHGHLIGDQVLIKVATILKKLRRGDFPGRYGGEEFCILSTNTDLAGAEALAERLRKGIEQQALANGDSLPRVTCSIGVAQFDATMSTSQGLLRHADEALYRAKQAGRNRVFIAHPPQQSGPHR
jgi:diguanylate cyclase (GGDEF)-like protein